MVPVFRPASTLFELRGRDAIYDELIRPMCVMAD